MFYKNLNVFLPYYALVAYVFGSLIYVAIMFALSNVVNIDKHHLLIGALAQAVIILSLLLIWARYGLTPIPKEGRQGLSKKGYIIVAIGNFIILTVAALLMLVGMAYGTFSNSIFLAIPFIGIAVVSWLVGIVMIWMSANGT